MGNHPSRETQVLKRETHAFQWETRALQGETPPSSGKPKPSSGKLQRETQVLQLHLRRNFRSAVAAHVCFRLLLLSGMSGQAVPKSGQAVSNGDLWSGMSVRECQLLPVVCPAAQITTVGRQLRVFPRWVRFVELTVSLRAHLPRGVPSFFLRKARSRSGAAIDCQGGDLDWQRARQQRRRHNGIFYPD